MRKRDLQQCLSSVEGGVGAGDVICNRACPGWKTRVELGKALGKACVTCAVLRIIRRTVGETTTFVALKGGGVTLRHGYIFNIPCMGGGSGCSGQAVIATA